MKPPSISELRDISVALGFQADDRELATFSHIIEREILPAFNELEQAEEPKLLADGARRDPGHFPSRQENRFGAWAWKCSVKTSSGGILAGKKIALKDNISLAGVPMTNGTRALKDFVPSIDAEVARRILAAGGEIVGKATCENFCWTGGSVTSFPQPVLNPRDIRFMAGGSSSGSGALVAAGDVDMAVGCDQGGSIRIPSSWCGIYGLKPTYGLVPYTGIITGEMTFDHAGPMASSVEGVALLLEAIAGRDGMDSRQAMAGTPMETPRYFSHLRADASKLKIGVVHEGFAWNESEADVDVTVKKAASHFEELGARVEEVSIPIHRKTAMLMFGIDSEGSWRALRNRGIDFGTFGYFNSDLAGYLGEHLRMDDTDFAPNAKLIAIFGEYMIKKYHSVLYTKAQNIRPSVKKQYNEALDRYNLLLMPTTPQKAQPFPEKEKDLAKYLSAGWNMVANVAPFDYTGHPALNIPCRESQGLPVGMMLVGKPFDEQTILNAALAMEKLSSTK